MKLLKIILLIAIAFIIFKIFTMELDYTNWPTIAIFIFEKGSLLIFLALFFYIMTFNFKDWLNK